MPLAQREPLNRDFSCNELAIHIDDRDVEQLIEPYVIEKFAASDPVWLQLVADNAKQQRRFRIRRQLLGWLSRFRRTQAGIRGAYSRMWASLSFEEQLRGSGGATLFEWRGRGLRAESVGYKRVHLLFFVRLIEQLRPANVLEVGCGNGLNLLVLSSCFPEIRFTGVELTAGGVGALEAVRTREIFPPSIEAFSPIPLHDKEAFRLITSMQGNAAALPFANRSFDMVFTSLALEQMEEVREKALSEIARVARNHTAMLEPFHEWNEMGSRRDYILANDYFAGKISDLALFGLEPVYITADMPAKLTFQPGMVVCRKNQSPR